MKKRVLRNKLLTGVIFLLLVSMVLSGCGGQSGSQPAEPASGQSSAPAEAPSNYPARAMEFVAPAGAGGGWDLTIRTVGRILQETGIVEVPMPVTNREGGGGGVNLAYMQEKAGSDDYIAVYSPPLLLINLNGSTQLSYENTTPLARLITDYQAFMVGQNSQYSNIHEVMEALKADPKSVKVAGTSAAGSMDHIAFLIIAKEAGVENLSEIDYIAFQDGSSASQLMGGHVDLLSTSLSQVSGLIESGDLVVLAQTAPHRVGTGVMGEIPTCIEEGINATFENWRGLFGPPEMPGYAVDYWSEVLAEMVTTDEWQAALVSNGWDDAYLDAAGFKSFLEIANESYKMILDEIGMLAE
ncbi:Bug family tripartite tricarboxylate transporter substrate binding protein [Anoxynatronum buryatiense]|uniref:Tricarboxylic transport membrane protein n=1 Tax=Anoxynatronum buryatiense TaxID=489973 RepID=A0AA45WYD1_9CLOT|nr:tripartite tricarboxylate transporter substrate-binding protein [Anoxynatronum buryatiense]SMP68484.1 putative tricarboxylic transport membrane protein [Anoxynatronum buryatiense]